MALNETKLRNMILFIASHPLVKDLGLTKLYKLLYYSDVTLLREHGRTISGSDYIKYKHGPVPSRAEKMLKRLRKEAQVTVQPRSHFNFDLFEVKPLVNSEPVFSPEELAALELVCKTKGQLTATELSDQSHDEPAWEYAPMHQKLEPELMAYGTSEDPDGL